MHLWCGNTQYENTGFSAGEDDFERVRREVVREQMKKLWTLRI